MLFFKFYCEKIKWVKRAEIEKYIFNKNCQLPPNCILQSYLLKGRDILLSGDIFWKGELSLSAEGHWGSGVQSYEPLRGDSAEHSIWSDDASMKIKLDLCCLCRGAMTGCMMLLR